MASGPMVGGDEGAKEKQRNTERKVYTRKVFRGTKKDPNVLNTAALVTIPTAKKDDTATSINNTPAATTSVAAAETENTASVKNDTATGKNDDTVTGLNDTATATNSTTAETDSTATAKNDDAVTAVNNTATATTTTTPAETDNTATGRDDDTASAAAPTSATATSAPTAISTVTTTTSNMGDINTNSTIKNSEVNEPRSNSNDTPLAVPEDVNLAQPQVSSILEDGRTADVQDNSRLENDYSASLQASSRLDDGDTAQRLVVSSSVEEKMAQPQVSSKLGDGDTAPTQVVSSLEDATMDQPQVSFRLEDVDAALPQVVSNLDKNLDQPQESSRLKDGDTADLQVVSSLEDGSMAQPQVNSRLEDGDSTQPKVVSRLEDENLVQVQVSSRLEDGDSGLPQVNSRLEAGSSPQQPVVQVSDDSCRHQQEEPSSCNVQRDDTIPVGIEFQEGAVPSTQNLQSGNEAMEPGLEEKIKISLSTKSKQEMRELRLKLESELDVVRNLVKRIELKQGQVVGYSRLNVLVGDRIDNGSGTKRALSEVSSVGVPRESTRPLHQLNLSMIENSHGASEYVEKEKRTPKANQFYHNSEFLLAKDKFPPAESNKKSKLHWKKQGAAEMGHGMGSKFYKSCSSLLEKLMKHKHGWVFNDPVDVEGLGLHDYFSIITHPMDLGTVKTRLNKNWYKSPREFAEDVRLTFRNAMTYNPKGQDVHVMAEQLSKIFEDRWAIIESDYNREMRYGIDYGPAPPAPSPLSRKVPTFPPPPLDMRRILNRSESLSHTPRLLSSTPSSRTPAPKKPKAKDPNKRDMTFEEKQKLSTNLQSLPSEKLDAIVQIIKKRTVALSQHDDEIEVDIDSVDAETLWELDRFVTNYKKSLSKNKRKLELAQARAEAQRNALQKNQVPVMQIEVPKETQANDRNVPPSTMQGGNQADNGSRSSSSSSSSSDSGSSSSDSDSDSSSASGSDAGSQGT